MNERTEPGFSSPPCYLHEFDPDALVERLNELVESERAGARSLIRMTAERADDEMNEVLTQVARDEARFCAMLRRHVLRLGGTPSGSTGAFLDKFVARESDTDRLQLLDRGQSVVVRVLEELLEQPLDQALRTDLEEMRLVHLENIDRCAAFLS